MLTAQQQAISNSRFAKYTAKAMQCSKQSNSTNVKCAFANLMDAYTMLACNWAAVTQQQVQQFSLACTAVTFCVVCSNVQHKLKTMKDVAAMQRSVSQNATNA